MATRRRSTALSDGRAARDRRRARRADRRAGRGREARRVRGADTVLADEARPRAARSPTVRFAETKEVVGGFYLLDCASDEEALDVAKRIPASPGLSVEVRPRSTSDDTAPVITGRTRLVGLLGDPVAGSLSPRMQNAAFAALALDWAYVPLPVAADGLAAAVRGLAALGFAGANVTIPHKRAVVALCDELDPDAERAGSVNTLVFRDGRVLGSSHRRRGGPLGASTRPAGARSCSARAARRSSVVAALREAGAEVVVVATRRDHGWPPAGDGFDVLVNATPVRDEVLVAPRPRPAGRRPRLPRRRRADRARRRRTRRRLRAGRRRARGARPPGRRVVRALDGHRPRRSTSCARR